MHVIVPNNFFNFNVILWLYSHPLGPVHGSGIKRQYLVLRGGGGGGVWGGDRRVRVCSYAAFEGGW